MINDSTSSDPSTPPTTRNVRQSAKGPSSSTEEYETEDTAGGRDDSAAESGSLSLITVFLIQLL